MEHSRSNEVLTLLEVAPDSLWLEWLPEVTSTMDVAREMHLKEPQRSVVCIADRQTRGRGQSGRTWKSAPDSLALTVALPVDERTVIPSSVTLAVGLLVAQTFEKVGVRLLLKWPNDLVTDRGEKVGGILCERIQRALLVGIGVNLAALPDGLDRAVGCIAHLTDTSVSKVQVVARIVDVLLQEWRNSLQQGIEPYQVQWMARAYGLGRAWTVETPQQGVLIGICRGIRSSGEVVLQTPHGETLIGSGHVVQISSAPE